MATTTNMDKMTRTAREMTEAQRDSYEALTENLAATQRRSVGLAQDGLKFFRLQEENAKAAQQWFVSSVRVAQLQQRNAEFVQGWTSDAVEAVREQTEHNVRTVEAFARSARKQQEGFRALVQGWTDVYEGFFFSPFKYAQESTEQGLKATQRVVEQGAETTQQVARQGLRVAEEATEQTEEVLRQTEQATREVELRVSVLSALETADYEGMTVAEITEKLDDLSADELKKLREFEKRNKDRESLVERIDRKIKANS